jgi:predicted transcriptional regulator
VRGSIFLLALSILGLVPVKKIERGHIRRQLICELAKGERTQVELAEDFGVDQSTVSAFMKRHAGEIIEVQRDIADKYLGLWIADKALRLAEIQQIIDDIETVTGDNGSPDADLVRVKLTALRNAAEELGQLPARVIHKVEGSIKTIIVGVDPDVDLT